MSSEHHSIDHRLARIELQLNFVLNLLVNHVVNDDLATKAAIAQDIEKLKASSDAIAANTPAAPGAAARKK